MHGTIENSCNDSTGLKARQVISCFQISFITNHFDRRWFSRFNNVKRPVAYIEKT